MNTLADDQSPMFRQAGEAATASGREPVRAESLTDRARVAGLARQLAECSDHSDVAAELVDRLLAMTAHTDQVVSRLALLWLGAAALRCPGQADRIAAELSARFPPSEQADRWRYEHGSSSPVPLYEARDPAAWVRTLLRCGAGGLRVLLARLARPHWPHRRLALEELANGCQTSGALSVELLGSVLADPWVPADLFVAVARYVSRLGTAAASLVPALLAARQRPEPQVRSAAEYALRWLQPVVFCS